MTAASVVAIPGVASVALAPNLAMFYLGWALDRDRHGRHALSARVRRPDPLGRSATGTRPHHADARRRPGQHRLRPTRLTPRRPGSAGAGAYLILLAGLVLITVPLHWWGLDHPWRTADPASLEQPTTSQAAVQAAAPSTAHAAAAVRSRPFVLLATANALTALAVFAVIINLVPMLVEQGLSRNLAAVALGLGGVGQVVGRLGYARFAAATSVTVRSVVVLAAVAVATAALALAPTSAGVLIVLGMVLGLARGIYTLVQATAVTDRWGPAAYGTLNGILTAPALAAAAVAPFVGAALAQVLGSYADAFLVLAA